MKILIFIILLFPNLCFAEYRVYQYIVKARKNLTYDAKAYTVTSTLSPTGYLAYHGGKDSVKIDLLQSWICLGDTSNMKKHCTGPLNSFNNKERELAQTETE
jgi:hypothetical protein